MNLHAQAHMHECRKNEAFSAVICKSESERLCVLSNHSLSLSLHIFGIAHTHLPDTQIQNKRGSVLQRIFPTLSSSLMPK